MGYIDSDKTNPAHWLVKVMICRVGNIRKRGRGVTWITIKIGKIVISHITQEMSKSNKVKQTNTQTSKKKKSNLS